MHAGKFSTAARLLLYREFDGVMQINAGIEERTELERFRKASATGDGMTLVKIIRLKKVKQGATAMEQTNSQMGKQSFWQLVFSQSKVNGAPYHGENLPGRTWDWPKDTYLQRRLQKSKWFQSTGNNKVN